MITYQTIIFPALFIGGGLLGWTMDTSYRWWVDGRYLPGTLVPYFSLIYGAGAMMLYSLFGIHTIPFVWDIVIGTILCVLLELVGGFMALSLLRRRLWDYSASYGNFHGFIDVQHSFYWFILTAIYRTLYTVFI